ncbi:MAG: hypothetical protein AAGG72_10530 [Pseudomonadota bacterium]
MIGLVNTVLNFALNTRAGSAVMFAIIMFGSVIWWRVDRAEHAERAAAAARVETATTIETQSRVKAKEIAREVVRKTGPVRERGAAERLRQRWCVDC